MTTDEIRAKAYELGDKGIDRRTTETHFDAVLGRAMDRDERAAAVAGWTDGKRARTKRRPETVGPQ